MEATEDKKPEKPEPTIDELKAQHAKELAVLNTRIAVLTHRWQEAEQRYNDALVQINTPKE